MKHFLKTRDKLWWGSVTNNQLQQHKLNVEIKFILLNNNLNQ